MTTLRFFGRPLPSRRSLYAIMAILVAIPVLAFAIGPFSAGSFALRGPGGPLLAFSAGVLSFVSPCVLPLVPIYLTHLSGASVEDGRIVANRRVTFVHALSFVGGLSFVFILLGVSVGLLGTYLLADYQRDLEQFAGLFLVLMGVVLMPAQGRSSPIRAALLLLLLTLAYVFLAEVADLKGDRQRLLLLAAVLALVWFRFAGYLQFSPLSRTFEVNVKRRQVGYTRSALVGGAFALGWTPCVGPILGSILTLAATSSDALTGAYLLVAYSAGFSIPFLIAGLALGDATRFLRRITPYTPYIEVASGVMLVGLGVLLVSGRLTGLNTYFSFADFNRGL
ncbi:MAG: cytochrome c biogenesis protein CcdA [Tepidiformaceae bacterium]